MFGSPKFKDWVRWKVCRAHVCTVAASLGVAVVWRVPRDCARFGALPYLLARTLALLVVAAPLALLQLSVGHLSQQDAVGVWRAVPFFKGAGYLRLVTGAVYAVSTGAYAGLAAALLIYTVANNAQFPDCGTTTLPVNDSSVSNDTGLCLEQSFLSPVWSRPEYYAAPALLTLTIFLLMPFLLYSPLRFMRRVLYVLGPATLCAAAALAGGAGAVGRLAGLARADWRQLLAPPVWQAALSQALLASHVATGYLHSAGGTVYADVDVQWAAVGIISTSVVCEWCAALLWYGIAGAELDTSPFAALHGALVTAAAGPAWPAVAFAVLLLSALITLVTVMYPLLSHAGRAAHGRVAGAAGAMLLAGGALVVGAGAGGRASLLSSLDDRLLPTLLTINTMQELTGFIFVYGWKTLAGDIEFMSGRKLSAYFKCGWWAGSPLVAGVGLWWGVTMVRAGDPNWPLLAVAVALAFGLFATFAVLVIIRQQQYGYFAKLMSSFRPSRQWGPRDPITHYYWMSREARGASGVIMRDLSSWRPGQISMVGEIGGHLTTTHTIASTPTTPSTPPTSPLPAEKRRTQSDDWLWTGHRKKQISFQPEASKSRSKSLEWIQVLCSGRAAADDDDVGKAPALLVVDVHREMTASSDSLPRLHTSHHAHTKT